MKGQNNIEMGDKLFKNKRILAKGVAEYGVACFPILGSVEEGAREDDWWFADFVPVIEEPLLKL